MNPQFYKKKNNIYTLLNIHFGYLLAALVFLFFFARVLTYEFNANNIKDKNSLLILMSSAGLFFLAFSFHIIEINTDKKTISKKRIFTLWKQIIDYNKENINFSTIRESQNGIYSGTDILLEIPNKRIILKRIFNSNKITYFINETKTILEN